MIIMKVLIKLLLLIFYSTLAWSQLVVSPNLNSNFNLECGTKLTQGQIDYMNNTRESRAGIDLEAFRSSIPVDPVIIPIAAHVIIEEKDVNGNPIIEDQDMTVAEVDQAIERLNELFESTLIQFNRCWAVNYIAEAGHPSGEDFYPDLVVDDLSDNDHEQSTEFIIARSAIINKGAINIFFAPNLTNGEAFPKEYCGFASFPYYREEFEKDWILIKNECALPSTLLSGVISEASTLAHEMGHFFNLYHTHQGKSDDLNIYEDENVARPTDGTNVCLPGEECNCGPNVGDELCDTPADPTFLCYSNCLSPFRSSQELIYRIKNCSSNIDGTPQCKLSHTVLTTCDMEDDFGNLYVPNTDNIMSYNHNGCKTRFSDGQIERMQRSLLYDRRYLSNCLCSPFFYNCSCLPDAFIENEIYIADIQFEDVEVSNSIVTNNLVKVSALANVKFDAGNFICLNPGFGAKYGSVFQGIIDGCAGEYRHASQNMTNIDLNGFNVYPNPVSSQATISYELKSDGEVSFSLFDTTGKQIATLLYNERKVSGSNQFNFDVSGLPAGIYYCTMLANEHIETQKLVITK